jgi:hypothetical protein
VACDTNKTAEHGYPARRASALRPDASVQTGDDGMIGVTSPITLKMAGAGFRV